MGFPGFNGAGLLAMMTVFDWSGASYWPQQTGCVLDTILWMMILGLSISLWTQVSRPRALCHSGSYMRTALCLCL